jgi:hypothetical protein
MSESENDTFWIGLEDFVRIFDNIDICRVDEWDEIRLRGKFTKSSNPDEGYASKSMYGFEVSSKTHLIIGMHQDDVKQSTSFGSYLDMGIALLWLDKDQGTSLVKYLEPTEARDVELECILDPGSYLILPKTFGYDFS